ncbi:MAG TPA: hypothetical protein VHB27_13200 [Rhodopila sp.]|nr:hypothetical protein [Rhodopila sp.]HVY16175.1 hypothetical protein [Rhodopila sp.]
MNDPAPHDAAAKPIRPVGAWVIAGFLTVAIVVTWVLVAVIFHARS